MTNLTEEQQTEKYLTEEHLISELKECSLGYDPVGLMGYCAHKWLDRIKAEEEREFEND